MSQNDTTKWCKRCALDQQKRCGRERIEHTCSKAQLQLPGVDGKPLCWWRDDKWGTRKR